MGMCHGVHKTVYCTWSNVENWFILRNRVISLVATAAALAVGLLVSFVRWGMRIVILVVRTLHSRSRMWRIQSMKCLLEKHCKRVNRWLHSINLSTRMCLIIIEIGALLLQFWNKKISHFFCTENRFPLKRIDRGAVQLPLMGLRMGCMMPSVLLDSTWYRLPLFKYLFKIWIVVATLILVPYEVFFILGLLPNYGFLILE